MIESLIESLRTDEGYRESWRANIAMAIYDTRRNTGEPFHVWRNRCADTFLNRLCGTDANGKPIEDDLPGMIALAASVAPPEEQK